MRPALAVAIAAFTLVVGGAAVTVRLKADTTYDTVRLKADTTYKTYVESGFSRTVLQATPGRFTVIISDLHLGYGRDPATGQWQPTEDFRWADAFGAFLRAIDQAGKGSTDLVLNGDTFELRQPIGSECRHPDPRLGCTEAEALTRLERVIAAHAAEMGDLGAFARAGGNRVIVVPGDHDAALIFPAVTQRVVAAVNAPGRVTVSTAGYWASPDGAVYAEHGHQMAGDPFRFSSWPEPLIHEGGRAHLERTWGEQLLQGVYDRHEPRYPILDNVVQAGAGLRYLATADPAALPAAGIGPVLRFFASRPTWQQFRLDLDGGDVQPPEWDLAATRARGAAFLVESLALDDRLRGLAEAALKDGSLRIDPGGLTDPEIVAICDYRAALRRARRRLERSLTQIPHVGPALTECARTPATRGSAFEYFWRSRDARLADRLEQAKRAIDRGGQPSSLKTLVFGHQHLADNGFVPVRAADSPIVINSGAWQRTVTPFQMDELIKTRGAVEADLLRQLQPEDLPACYGVAWIEPYVDRPIPRLRFWRGEGRWGGLARDAAGIANACAGGGPGSVP
jgi:hypothetical protein